ncbi:MAG: tetratricopeptide repeat protein [Thermoguttaceae bacterium]
MNSDLPTDARSSIKWSGFPELFDADSPYIDQLLILAAQSDLAQNDRERAIARLESLVKSYPGSTLVPTVKEKIAELKGGGAEPKNERTKPPAARKEE